MNAQIQANLAGFTFLSTNTDLSILEETESESQDANPLASPNQGYNQYPSIPKGRSADKAE